MGQLRGKRIFILFLIVAVIVVAFFAGRYSVRSITGIAENNTSAHTPSTWTVKEESIGRSITMQASLSRSNSSAPQTYKEGVVTACEVTSTMTIEENTPLASINLSPIVAGQGTIPAFRDLEEGMSGDDVVQLRAFLCRRGYQVCGTNPVFTPALTNAVQQWQKKAGMEVTGTVKAGDIMWFPALPATASPEATCTVGTNVDANSHLFRLTSSTPLMYLDISENQTEFFSPGNVVLFESGEKGILGDFTQQQKTEGDPNATEGNDTYRAEILSEDGLHNFCEAHTNVCNASIGSKDKASLIVRIENMKEEHGIGVPLSAIQINARGDTYVVDEKGKEIPVNVLNSDSSIALVDGVKAGTVITLHGKTEP